ncbi:hypothetical protein BDB00DRAFT_295775 [Zychaea mexicana]|uniref:uncharacterized protein n=1 Tax=Zychaea mexicana TaxID=64656 RepID=UPI0022FEBAD5|nr:uncharacterized protein BDB00DRAFT_295775 [Zychaea mexicana]KAI9494597.1 hypothetical protein BDB00DRAFT_295775 [Zychaea mexicana]
MSKGGRHRIFTEEQRKDRNRLAQAAFRARRSEYTHTLEQTVVGLESIVKELQDSNRQTSTRADAAEARCQLLKDRLRHLHEQLHAALLENQRLSSAQVTASLPSPSSVSTCSSSSSSSSSLIDPTEAISTWLGKCFFANAILYI